jgi:anti-sigma factor RsiW
VSTHLGADLAALVDGELGHAARERVLRHLTRCADCRAEAADQRRLASCLREHRGSAPAPDEDLLARLRAVAARPDGEPAPAPVGRGRLLPVAAVGGTVLALGIGAVLVLTAPARTPTRGPGTDAVLTDSLTGPGDQPLREPAGVQTARLGR